MSGFTYQAIGVAMVTLAALLTPLASAQAPSVAVLTERSPFTRSESPEIPGGEATRFVEALLARAKLDYTLSYLPWRRAYRNVLSQPNTMIYPLARSRGRESQFLWVGELIPVNYYLFRLRSRSDIKLDSIDDAQQYRVGVVNYHVHHEYLKEQGLSDLHPVNSNLQNFKKAALDRIDLFPMSDGGLEPICRQHSIDCSQFEPVLKLSGISGGLYLAFSLDSDPAAVAAARTSYEALATEGEHERIFSLRLKEVERFNAQWPVIAADDRSVK